MLRLNTLGWAPALLSFSKVLPLRIVFSYSFLNNSFFVHAELMLPVAILWHYDKTFSLCHWLLPEQKAKGLEIQTSTSWFIKLCRSSKRVGINLIRSNSLVMSRRYSCMRMVILALECWMYWVISSFYENYAFESIRPNSLNKILLSPKPHKNSSCRQQSLSSSATCSLGSSVLSRPAAMNCTQLISWFSSKVIHLQFRTMRNAFLVVLKYTCRLLYCEIQEVNFKYIVIVTLPIMPSGDDDAYHVYLAFLSSAEQTNQLKNVS